MNLFLPVELYIEILPFLLILLLNVELGQCLSQIRFRVRVKDAYII